MIIILNSFVCLFRERSFHRKGLTLQELAQLLLDHGIQYAVNMDGGGSSTMVMMKMKQKSQ